MKRMIHFWTVLLLLGTAACEDVARAKIDIGFLKEAASQIETMSPRSPARLSREEQVMLERYFKTVAYWIQYGEKNDRKKWAKLESRAELDCREIMISRNTWELLNASCEIDGFYLCPEEMKMYGRLLDRAKQLISSCH